MRNGDTRSNQAVYGAGERAVYWAVHRAVYTALDDAGALDDDVYGDVYGAVYNAHNAAVNGAVDGAVYEDTPHPALELYLMVVACCGIKAWSGPCIGPCPTPCLGSWPITEENSWTMP
jgi:hypothetical protein